MSLGIALSRLKVLSWAQASLLGGARVIIGPLIGISLIKYLNLSGFVTGPFYTVRYAKRYINLFSRINVFE